MYIYCMSCFHLVELQVQTIVEVTKFNHVVDFCSQSQHWRFLVEQNINNNNNKNKYGVILPVL